MRNVWLRVRTLELNFPLFNEDVSIDTFGVIETVVELRKIYTLNVLKFGQ